MIPRLWVISPGDGRALGPALRVFGRIGVRGVVLREASPVARWVDEAREAGFTHVFAHLRAPDAHTARADGIHLPDGAPAVSGAWGRSSHAPADARAALDAGAAYTFLAPIWRPSSKPDDRRPPLGLAAALAAGPGPVLALGGVDAARYRALRAAGLYGAAVLGDWWDDPERLAAFYPPNGNSSGE